MSEKEEKILQAVPDPFDLDNLILPQDFAPLGEKQITRLRVKKPHRLEWVAVHPKLEIRVMLFERSYEMDKEIFIVARPMVDTFREEGKPCMLYPYVTQDGALRLWPVRLPDPDTGKLDSYSETAHDAATRYRGKWIRVAANRREAQYEVTLMKRKAAPPRFPDLTEEEMLRLAFKDKVIDSLDHPAIADLELGE